MPTNAKENAAKNAAKNAAQNAFENANLIAYKALLNEYDFYRKNTADPVSGKPATAALRQLYSSKSFKLMNSVLRFADKLRGIKPALKETATTQEIGQNQTKNLLPKIAMLVDYHGWAFDNATKQITSRLSHKFNFTVFYLCDEECNHVAKVLFALKGFDLVHVFWRGYIGNMTSDWCRDYIKGLGGDFNAFLDEYYHPLKISTCVADPLLFKPEYTQQASFVLSKAICYYTVSEKLFEIYSKDSRFPKPFTVIYDFVNLKVFVPQNLQRFNNIQNRTLVVGWAGNSEWNEHGAEDDLKGVHTVIKPAVQALKNQGYNIQLKMADRKDGIIPHSQMPAYYNSIDVYVCASTEEGTPNPILEAMACGLAVISTNVGVVPEIFGKNQQQFILQQRSAKGLEDLLKKLINNPEIMQKLSQENLQKIKPWSWEIGAAHYENYFAHALKVACAKSK